LTSCRKNLYADLSEGVKYMNIKKIIGEAVVAGAIFGSSALPVLAAGGFDEFGYNRTAMIFNGTGSSWCQAKSLPANCQGIYSPDKLVMKWNAEWDRGNAEGWANPPYAAWENNEWNGKNGGSGTVWHYKIVWVGNYNANPSLIPDGGYGIWGQFAVLMDQGTDPSFGPGHIWFAHANPSGYGAY